MSTRPALADSPNPAAHDRLFPAPVRADFPSVLAETYLDSAAQHPLGTFAVRGIERYMASRLQGRGQDRAEQSGDILTGVRQRYARLVHASPNVFRWGYVTATRPRTTAHICTDHVRAIRRIRVTRTQRNVEPCGFVTAR